MSGADFFDDGFAINAYMDADLQVNLERAKQDHKNIHKALTDAGIEVIKVDPPTGCQDGVYTANWALCVEDKVILSRLPGPRQAEEAYAKETLTNLGKKPILVPNNLRFSGQGDALPCGGYLLTGSHYRTDIETHKFLSDMLDTEVVSLQTMPQLDKHGQEVINAVTGWPDSFFYDIDLAIAVIDDETIAWCPEAFIPESQDKIARLPLRKIEVSLQEATEGLACNLVSTGNTIIMSSHAPLLASQLELHGFKIAHPNVTELQKGGGFIRCTTLTLS